MDKYTQFRFNGVHSSAYNLFYVNNDGGLRYPFSPSFSQNTTRPMYQGRTFYLGTDVGEQVFQLTLAAEKLTNAERRAIFDWLDIGKPSYITFDAFPNYKQKVIITNIGEGTIYPREWKNGLIENIVEFPVEMQTVGNPYPETNTLTADGEGPFALDPETRLPIYIVEDPDPTSQTFKFLNWTSINQYFSLTVTASNSLTITDHNQNILYSITKPYQFILHIDGETGIGRLRSENNILAEMSSDKVRSNGPLIIPNSLVFNGKVKLNLSTGKLDDYITKIGSICESGLDLPLEIAILPLQKETSQTSEVKGYTVGTYPSTKTESGEDRLDNPVYISVPEGANLEAEIDRSVYPWISDKEEAYHVIVTRPMNVTITAGAIENFETSLQMSYRNRL